METSHRRHSSPILRIMECIIASVFTRRAKRETECGEKSKKQSNSAHVAVGLQGALTRKKNPERNEKMSIKSGDSLIHGTLLPREEW